MFWCFTYLMALNLATFSSASFPIWANKKKKRCGCSILWHPWMFQIAQPWLTRAITFTLTPFLTTVKAYAHLLCELSQGSLGQRTSPALPYLILQVTNPFTRIWCTCVVSSVLTPEPNVGGVHPVSADLSQQQAYTRVKLMNLQVFSHIGTIHVRWVVLAIFCVHILKLCFKNRVFLTQNTVKQTLRGIKPWQKLLFKLVSHSEEGGKPF